MTEKFTQGEWRVEITDHELADTGDYVTDFAVATEKTGVAQCFDNSVINEEEAAANCHLIAAAPSMYALLKLMTEPTFMGATIPQYCRTTIEAVLKKARGEE
jgi:hypothetical protein